jgi:hypothetical protein
MPDYERTRIRVVCGDHPDYSAPKYDTRERDVEDDTVEYFRSGIAEAHQLGTPLLPENDLTGVSVYLRNISQEDVIILVMLNASAVDPDIALYLKPGCAAKFSAAALDLTGTPNPVFAASASGEAKVFYYISGS